MFWNKISKSHVDKQKTKAWRRSVTPFSEYVNPVREKLLNTIESTLEYS